MADKGWFHARPGEPPAGPVSAAELKRLAAAGALRPDDLVSRTPDGRQARADTVPGLFPDADSGNPFAFGGPATAPAAEPPPVAPTATPTAPAPGRTRRPAAGPSPAEPPRVPRERRPGGLLDLGFTRFVTPTLLKVLWAVWLFVLLPLGVLGVVGFAGLALTAGPRPADPRLGPAAAGPNPLLTLGLAAAQLLGLAVSTLVVRVVLESVAVVFRGAEAVMAIDARQRAVGGEPG